MSESRLEELFAYFFSVQEYAIYAQPGSHPNGFFHLRRIDGLAHEPAGTIRCPLTGFFCRALDKFADFAFNNWRIGCRNPF